MALMKVMYKGLSDRRIMSKKDLAKKDVHLDSDLEWSRNGSVYVESPSDELLALFKAEGTFNVTEVDEKGQPKGEDIVSHTKRDDTGDTVVDGATGQVSTKPPAETTGDKSKK